MADWTPDQIMQKKRWILDRALQLNSEREAKEEARRQENEGKEDSDKDHGENEPG